MNFALSSTESTLLWQLGAILLSVLATLATRHWLTLLGPWLARRRLTLQARYLTESRRTVAFGGDGSGAMGLKPESVILSRLGLPEWVTLNHLRVAAASWPLLGFVAGVPWVIVVSVAGLSSIMAHSWLASRWTKFVTSIEADLGPLSGRLYATLSLTESTSLALVRALEALPPGTPTRMWMERLATGLETEGPPFLLAALPNAQQISPSLALLVLQLERCVQAGGKAHAEAFLAASDRLAGVLDARATVSAKAGKARGTVTMFLIMLAIMSAYMMSSPNMREGFQSPIAQIAIGASLIVMLIGYLIIQGMIREALLA